MAPPRRRAVTVSTVVLDSSFRSLKQSRRYDFRARAEGRCRRWLKGVEPYLPQLHCLRPRWNSATASSNACAARTVVMSGVEKLIGEVADL